MSARRNLAVLITILALLAAACGNAQTTTTTRSAPDDTTDGRSVREPDQVLDAEDDEATGTDIDDDPPTDLALVTDKNDNTYGFSDDFELSDGMAALLANRAVADLEAADIAAPGTDLTDEQAECVSDSLLALAPELGGYDDAYSGSAEDQALALLALVECLPEDLEADFLAGFASSAVDADLADAEIDAVVLEMATCIVGGLDEGSPDRQLIAGAIVAIAAGTPAPGETIDPTVDLFVECVDLDTLLRSSLAADPTFGDVVDIDCLVGAYDDDFLELMFREALRNPTAELDIDSSEFDATLAAALECISYGEAFAAEMSAAGQPMSAATIDCIDSAFRQPEVFDAMMGGEDLPDEFLNSIFGCLSPEELGALFSG